MIPSSAPPAPVVWTSPWYVTLSKVTHELAASALESSSFSRLGFVAAPQGYSLDAEGLTYTNAGEAKKFISAFKAADNAFISESITPTPDECTVEARAEIPFRDHNCAHGFSLLPGHPS